MTTEVDVTLRPKGDIRPILVENLLASQSQIYTLVVGKEISSIHDPRRNGEIGSVPRIPSALDERCYEAPELRHGCAKIAENRPRNLLSPT